MRVFFIRRPWPYLPGLNRISPSAASMHNRSRCFVPNAVGQSTYLFPGAEQPHRHKSTQSTLTSSCSTPPSCCCFPSQELPLRSGSDCKHVQEKDFREAAKNHTEIGLMHARLQMCTRTLTAGVWLCADAQRLPAPYSCIPPVCGPLL